MLLENLPYHASSILSFVTDLLVGVLALQMWMTKGSKGFLILAVSCVFFFIGSVYDYATGLVEYGFFRWPLEGWTTYFAYLTITFIWMAAQITFVIAVVQIAREYRAKG